MPPKKNRHYWKLAFLVALIAGAALVYRFTDLHHYLHPTDLEKFRIEVQSFGWPGAIGFVGVYIFFVALGLPNLPFQLAAGAIWGIWRAYLMMYVGVNLGALGAFILARLLGRQSIEKIFGQRLTALNERIEHGGFRFVLILRLIPLMPFNAINYASGLSRLTLKQYLPANLLGMIPLTLVHVAFGAAVGDLGITSPKAFIENFHRPALFLPVLISAVMLIVSVIAHRRASR